MIAEAAKPATAERASEPVVAETTQPQTASPPPPAPQKTAPGTPLVVIRRSAAPSELVPPQNGNSTGVAKAPAPTEPPAPAPVKAKAPKAKPARAVPAAAPSRKDHERRERKHRRHSRRVTRRAASLDLKSGERVSLSIEGWSRFRRATLVVTNYRVALITRVPPQVRWIPLEEVSAVTRRWHGAYSIVVAAPTEVLTLQKSKRQILASFQELLDSEVKEARRGGNQRHHADITQEWCDRATLVWDSRFQRIRLWIRRHPAVTVVGLLLIGVGSFYLSALMTSWFSPVQ